MSNQFPPTQELPGTPTPRFDGPLSDLPPGARWGDGTLGRYVDVTVFARGGMGVILKGTDPDAEREVAIKIIEGGGDSSQRARFLAEGKVTAQLQHPSIIPVYEVGELPTGELFFAMKLVHGQPLGSRLASASPADLPRLLDVFGKICDAVAFAHSRGVIHRDLKPDNVMLGEFGEVLVMDWGLVRAAPAGSDRLAARDETGARKRDLRASTTVSRARRASGVDGGTLDGTILGTPAYMPPEQANGELERVDERSDVYSLGAILYHLLAGVPPYVEANVYQLLEMVAAGNLVPPSERAPQRHVPRELEAACLRAMASSPAKRYHTVAAFQADIEAYLDGRELVAAEYTLGQRLRRAAWRHRVALSLLLVALAGVGLALWQRHRAHRLQLDAALADARERIGKMVPPRDLPIDPVTRLPARAAWQKALENALAAASALDGARRLAPGDPDLARRRRKIGRALGETALVGREYGLARQAFADLVRHGMAPDDVAKLTARVDRLRDAQAAARRKRLAAIFDDFRAGLDRPGRALDAPRQSDYLFEVVSYRDRATVAALAATLRDLAARKRAQGQGQAGRWLPRERQLAIFCCRALGRIAMPESVDALFAFASSAVTDRELAVVAGHALCHTRQPAAFQALLRYMVTVGVNSAVWREIIPLLPRVPEPNTHPEMGDAYLESVALMRQYQGRKHAAREMLDMLIARRPEAASLRANRANLLLALGDLDRALADCNAALERSADNAAVLSNRATIYIRRQQYDAALLDLNRALEIDPENADGYSNRAAVYELRGHLDKALTDLDRALEIQPGATSYLVNRAKVKERLGRPRDAMLDLDKALELVPDNVRALTQRARLRQSTGDLDAALADLVRALDLATLPGDLATALAVRAQIALSRGDFAAAAADCKRGLAVHPDNPELLHIHVSILISRGDNAGAARLLDAVVARRPDDANLRMLRGQVRAGNGDYAGAIDDLDLAVARAPRSARMVLARARIHLIRGDHTRALADYDKAVALVPSAASYQSRAQARQRAGQTSGALSDYAEALRLAVDGTRKAKILEERARMYLRLGHTDKATDDVNRALRLSPRHWPSRLMHASLPYYVGQMAESGRRLDALVKERPEAADVRLMRASVRMGLQQYATALADVEFALPKLKVLAERERAFTLRARLLVATQQPQRALDSCDVWVRELPRSAMAHMERARVKIALNDRDGAFADLDKSIAISPAFTDALELRGSLRVQTGDAAGGIADFRLALKSSPRLWRIRYSLGATLARTGDRAGALAELRRALADAPETAKPTIQRAIQQLGG